jgi:probable F420-dependent oxidoreductase
LHHPALLARTVATLDRMTVGRVVLGIGTGYAQAEHEAMGIELRRPGPRVERLEESLVALRSLLDEGAVEMQGRHHRLAIGDLGVRPVQERVPMLVGGHGRRVIGVAGRVADIFQFTGLTHAADGTPERGGFRLGDVAERARWLTEAAGERDPVIERSVLVQRTQIGDGANGAADEAARRLGVDPDVVESTPFLLFGTVEHVVDRLESLRETLGISHVVVREALGFAPVVAALSGR